MKRLKIIKDIELRKNISINNISLKERIKSLNKKKRNLQKIYNYYFSKNKIEEKLMNQQISLMKKELDKKQKEEKNNFRDEFFKKYPSENNYNNEISNYIKEINKYKKENNINEAKKYEEMKENFLNKKHEEYIAKMGVEYENELVKLKEKFRKENDEQKIKIRKIILNRKIGEIEKQNDRNINSIRYNKRYYNGGFNLSQDNIYSFYCNNKDNAFLNNNSKNRLCSKVFKFGGSKKPYETIII